MTPLRDSVDAAYERWAYGEGWSAGLQEGRRRGFEEGYGAGFDTGVEVGGHRLLLGLQHALGSQLPSVLYGLPHTADYLTYRGLTALSDEPCAYACRACSRCIRTAAVRQNRRRHGQSDFPGAPAVRRGRSR